MRSDRPSVLYLLSTHQVFPGTKWGKDLVREVAGASEVHGDTGCFSGSNNFFIADGAAGLDNGGDAGIDKHLQAIGGWEERIRCCDGTASTLCGISQSIRAVY